MKICIISNLYPPYVIGGAEINVQREAEGLAQRGNQVSVITTSPHVTQDSTEMVNNVKVYRISPLNLYTEYEHRERPTIVKPLWHLIDLWNPHSYKLVKQILLKERPDIVHINNYKGLSLSIFTAANRLNIPTIFTAHDYSLLCIRANLLKHSGEICTNPGAACYSYNRIQKYLVNQKINILITSSQFVLDKLTEKGLFRNTRAVKLPYGIELSNERANKTYDTIDILYIGQVTMSKGVHVLINSFKKLNNINIKLNIVGTGQDMEYMKKLSNGDTRINFHGFIPNEKLARFYKEANLVVVPSVWYEAFGIVIIEAFSHGTPVIASNIGGPPEIIEDGENGHIFQPGNSEELKAIIEILINDPDRLRRLEEGAFKSSKKYSVAEHVNKLEELYHSLLD